MRLIYLHAAAIVLSVSAHMPALGQPLAGTFKLAPESGLIRRIHFWHCQKYFGWIRHWHGGRQHAHQRWHRHRRPCYPLRGQEYTPYNRRYKGTPFYRRRHTHPQF